MSEQLNNLEKILQFISSKNRNVFPIVSQNYFERYEKITDHLTTNVYPFINVGLSANSDEQGLYTDHGPEHFNMVVLYAGEMLGITSGCDLENIASASIENNWFLQPYELYLLLLSIRLHDVGNIYGRDKHEKNIRKVIREYNVPFLKDDTIEAALIAKSGGAHGGKTPSGSKDTISILPEDESEGHIKNVNLKKIAAIVRFADEICENRHRTSVYIERMTPKQNKVFHLYAKSITSSYIDNKVLNLKFQLDCKHLLETYPISASGNDKGITLPEMFLDRIKKTEMERRYCSRFLPDGISIKAISVCVKIIQYDEDEYIEELDKREFTLMENNYPGNDDGILSEDVKLFLSDSSLRKLIQKEESHE